MSKEERKYEIAEKETMGIFDPHELDITGLSNAMDIYAKEVAIEFAFWCGENSIGYEEDVWFYKDGTARHNYSTDEMYELFLQSKKQTP
jgi:hypothetical protein